MSVLDLEAAPLLAVSSEAYQRVHTWLLEESSLLDHRRYDAWLARISPSIIYRAPVRVTASYSLVDSARSDVALFDEDHHSLTKRMERFATEHAWSEDPPSRTRRFVTNIMAYGVGGDEVVARSYLLLYRSRGDVSPADLISAERRDVFGVGAEGQFLLERREVLVDDAVLRTLNLATIL